VPKIKISVYLGGKSMSEAVEKIIEDDPLLVPSKEEWACMTESERDFKESKIISILESEFNMMGEATIHFESRASATEVLRRYFKAKGQKIFIASDLHTLYPGERAFYPDLLVVFDADDYHRSSWNVLREGKGLDFVLEILSKEYKRNDLVEKLNLYARIGIPEYFIFDPDYLKLYGYKLAQNIYETISNDKGKFFSEILGLCIQIDENKLRFSLPEGIEIPFADELLSKLNEKLSRKDYLIVEYASQLEEERKRTEEEKKRTEEERKRADDAEKEIQRLKELLKLKP
jgi:Uma2 family endonuclease